MIKAKPIPICGKYVGQASMKKITPSIYSEKMIITIANIVNIQFINFLFLTKIKIDFVITKTEIIVGIKNQ